MKLPTGWHVACASGNDNLPEVWRNDDNERELTFVTVSTRQGGMTAWALILSEVGDGITVVQGVAPFDEISTALLDEARKLIG